MKMRLEHHFCIGILLGLTTYAVDGVAFFRRGGEVSSSSRRRRCLLFCRGGSSGNYPAGNSNVPDLPPDLPPMGGEDDEDDNIFGTREHQQQHPPQQYQQQPHHPQQQYNHHQQHQHYQYQQQQQQPPPLPSQGYGGNDGYGAPPPLPHGGPDQPYQQQQQPGDIFQEGLNAGDDLDPISSSSSPFDSSNEAGFDMSTFDKEYILKGLARLYRKKILPLEISSRYGHFHSPALSPADFVAPPMVLLLGQYR